ncbi:MAG: hypothetical protein KBT03_13820 [Bacteroidales bacterium]|nr:hypothetical protein [Candidatus Scybalousia scybalohippi]
MKFKDDDEKEYFEERAAIYEYLAHHSRQYAERLAWYDVINRRKKLKAY